ncbi:MAG: class I SAM-dependent methyltransferase [Acidimicrobiia bacterium]
MDSAEIESLLSEQIAYYRARAPEYDEAWFREGPHRGGEEFNRRWQIEIASLYNALDAFAPRGDVLEIAAGTGSSTAVLARYADRITALDSSPEALAVNRTRLAACTVLIDYVEADVFAWEPDRLYDVVSFAFWLSHVPIARFQRFWELVDSAMAPGGRFFFVDSAVPRPELPVSGRRFAHDGIAVEGVDGVTDLEEGTSIRRLADGRMFKIVKVFWAPPRLESRLAALGWSAQVSQTEWAFIYGSGQRAPARHRA